MKELIMEDKKPVFENFPTIDINVKAYDTKHNDSTNGRGLLTFTIFSTDVEDNEGNRIGSISGGLGSVVVAIGEEHYFQIKYDDLWWAVINAIKQGINDPEIPYHESE